MAHRSRNRCAVAVLTLGSMVGGLLLPPVHVHLDADHEGHEHSSAIVHQHWGGHDHDAASPEIEHGDHDGRVLVLDEHAIVSDGRAADHSAAVPEPIFFLAQVPGGDVPIRRIDTGAPSHGPPRRICALRGPPCLSI